ncbi:hypothetical protein HV344_25885 (plasmid) [Citrobacter freundii]|uniref:hypothetical protein n=1 Tax=Citrobacter freundii TaxID=546 RepID=UPI0015EA5A8A|nr:hypothetical protein [Citrobacter freundii]QLR55502.1 hypothetical protein HV344_25885 [Citrobacter freundii]
MIHKHIGGKKNQRSVKNSLDYLLRTNKPEEQQFVEVLSQTNRSDIENFNEYIKEKNFKNPFITGVLSFEEKDIDPELKTKIMNDFEDMMFSGIDPENRPPVIWIQHKDKNRLELNYTTFNSLMNKKHFQCYYHLSDKKLFNSFCEKVNYENNISSVLDVQEHKERNTLVNTLNNKIPEDKKAVVEKLQEDILSKIITEEINNREELISFIQSKNIIINRVRENAISIKFDKADKPISLKGDIYEQNRDYKTYRTESKINHRADQQYVENQLRQHRENFDTEIKKRNSRNRTRFKSTQSKDQKNVECRVKKSNDNKNVRSEISDNNNVLIGNEPNINFLHNNKTIEDVNNEQNFTNNKTKPREEEPAKFDLSREIEAANNQQQFIYKRVEEVGRNQQQFRKSLDRTQERSGVCRRSLHSIIHNIRRYVRTFSIHTRQNERRQKIEHRQKIFLEKLKTQQEKNNQRSVVRSRFKPY